MTAQSHETTPREVRPIAWLCGVWRGEGSIGYGPIPNGRVSQQLTFAVADGPYLAYTAKTWLLAADPADGFSEGVAGPADARTAPATWATPAEPAVGATPTSATVDGIGHRSPDVSKPKPWHEESGYWRVLPSASRKPPLELEVLIADAAGFLSLYVGEVSGQRASLGTDAMMRTASAPPVGAATRLYGLIQGDLLWTWDIAGFELELGSYMAVSLSRVEG
ncbi:MAG: FABP family protein [Bifidobacteriaceae bacterium]|nr:FABP family protein [Bifidobacteriaceae bacterium]